MRPGVTWGYNSSLTTHTLEVPTPPGLSRTRACGIIVWPQEVCRTVNGHFKICMLAVVEHQLIGDGLMPQSLAEKHERAARKRADLVFNLSSGAMIVLVVMVALLLING